MSDLREALIEAACGGTRKERGSFNWTQAQIAVDTALPIIEAELQKRDQEIERLKEEVICSSPWPERHRAIQERHGISFKVLETALNEANLEGLSWKASAEQNYAEWEEANKLLAQTIEVLEGFPHLGWRYEIQSWYRCKAKPLLDNLKALKKEGTE